MILPRPILKCEHPTPSSSRVFDGRGCERASSTISKTTPFTELQGVPPRRWRQVVALSRVTASAYGYNRDDKHGFRAAGYDAACKLLGVEV